MCETDARGVGWWGAHCHMEYVRRLSNSPALVVRKITWLPALLSSPGALSPVCLRARAMLTVRFFLVSPRRCLLARRRFGQVA
jgi:hypothetical protein